MDPRRIVVTGGNRGIGLEVVRQLARLGHLVVLASRDPTKGERSKEALAKEHLEVEVVPLDVVDPASISAFGALIARRFGTIDGLVNNAGVSMSGFDERVARRTIDVNFFGPLRVTEALLPVLRAPGATIAMVSSGLGSISAVSPSLAAEFMDPALSLPALIALVESFVDDVKAKVHAQRGWPSSAYAVSKVALNALVRVFGKQLAPRGILVNAINPGWVRTDMGGAGAPRSVEEGADTVTWAATLGPDGPSGGVFRDRAPTGW
jgi:NAD(P)-dependent dehydrogenase (short-subunit alcohol dehydrogenase family)